MTANGRSDPVAALVDAATAPYRSAGRFAWHFARGKLSGDPAFRALLEHGWIRDGALLDIGCGQGLLASWVSAARDLQAGGVWPDGWPPPPRLTSITGIELMVKDVARAAQALGDAARFVVGDMRRVPFPPSQTIVILDVLHYVPLSDQDAVLRRAHDALSEGGTLLLRIGDAGGGFGFRWSNWVDRTVMLARGHGWNPLHCRTLDAWRKTLGDLGFDVDSMPMSSGTPFANVMLIARKRGGES